MGDRTDQPESPIDNHLKAKNLVVGKRRRRSSSSKKSSGDGNKESLKEENEASQRSSPEPTCAICLEALRNKSFTDSCCHTFCFLCLKEWSKVKPECPLCKQPFKSIIHNLGGPNNFEHYYVDQRPRDMLDSQSRGFPFFAIERYRLENRRFRYTTTMTPGRLFQMRRTESMSLRSQMSEHRMRYAPHSMRIMNRLLPFTRPNPDQSSRRETRESGGVGSTNFRSMIYRNGLWVRSASGPNTRDISPAFYQANPAVTHRLVPWLTRELNALLSDRNQTTFLMELILELITVYEITSPEFFIHVEPYLRLNTNHFIHEFYNFALSPSFNYLTYDSTATYDMNREDQDLTGSPSQDNEVTITSESHPRPPRPVIPPITIQKIRSERNNRRALWRQKPSDFPRPTAPTYPRPLSPLPSTSGCRQLEYVAGLAVPTFSSSLSPLPSTSSSRPLDFSIQREFLVSDTTSSASSRNTSPDTVIESAEEGEIEILEPPPKKPPEVIDLSEDDDIVLDVETNVSSETKTPEILDSASDNDNSACDIEVVFEKTVPPRSDSSDVEITMEYSPAKSKSPSSVSQTEPSTSSRRLPTLPIRKITEVSRWTQDQPVNYSNLSNFWIPSSSGSTSSPSLFNSTYTNMFSHTSSPTATSWVRPWTPFSLYAPQSSSTTAYSHEPSTRPPERPPEPLSPPIYSSFQPLPALPFLTTYTPPPPPIRSSFLSQLLLSPRSSESPTFLSSPSTSESRSARDDRPEPEASPSAKDEHRKIKLRSVVVNYSLHKSRSRHDSEPKREKRDPDIKKERRDSESRSSHKKHKKKKKHKHKHRDHDDRMSD